MVLGKQKVPGECKSLDRMYFWQPIVSIHTEFDTVALEQLEAGIVLFNKNKIDIFPHEFIPLSSNKKFKL